MLTGHANVCSTAVQLSIHFISGVTGLHGLVFGGEKLGDRKNAPIPMLGLGSDRRRPMVFCICRLPCFCIVAGGSMTGKIMLIDYLLVATLFHDPRLYVADDWRRPYCARRWLC